MLGKGGLKTTLTVNGRLALRVPKEREPELPLDTKKKK
jgi:hypothetical protein